MIGIDTNILLRYLLRDDPAQTALAVRLLDRECSREEPGLVTSIVLCELVWVLVRLYGYHRDQVAAALELLLGAAELQFEHLDQAREALADYSDGSADFADYLIAHVNAAQGATKTATFDRQAATHRLFKLLK